MPETCGDRRRIASPHEIDAAIRAVTPDFQARLDTYSWLQLTQALLAGVHSETQAVFIDAFVEAGIETDFQVRLHPVDSQWRRIEIHLLGRAG